MLGVAKISRVVLQDAEGYDDVTYAPSGEKWLVLSGFRGEKVFYEKYLLRDGLIHAFGIEFPASAKPFYAPIVERIEDTFRACAPASASLASDTEKPPKVRILDSIPDEERPTRDLLSHLPPKVGVGTGPSHRCFLSPARCVVVRRFSN